MAEKKFQDPEVVTGQFFVRESRFNVEKNRMEFVLSPTDKDAREQETVVTILNDQSIDKNGILKKLMDSMGSVVDMGIVRERGDNFGNVYQVETLRKSPQVMGVDSDGKKRLAFTWTDALDHHVERWHGYQTKAQSVSLLATLSRSSEAMQTIGAAAQTEAALVYREMFPGATDVEAKKWVAENLQQKNSVLDILSQEKSYNTEHLLEDQCDWGKMTATDRALAISNYAHQKALQGSIVDQMTRPVRDADGAEISQLHSRENHLVEEGLLYAVNPTLTPELMDIENREYAERESGKAVRSAMSMFGAKPANHDLDDIRCGERETGPDGALRPATISAEILEHVASDPLHQQGKQMLKSGDVAGGAIQMLDALAGVTNSVSDHESTKLIYGKDHSIIAEQDDRGAVEKGFHRRHVDLDAERKKADEKLKERGSRALDIGAQGVDGLMDGPSVQIF